MLSEVNIRRATQLLAQSKCLAMQWQLTQVLHPMISGSDTSFGSHELSDLSEGAHPVCALFLHM